MANEEPGNGGPVETHSVFRLQLVREEPGMGAPKKLLLPGPAAQYAGRLLLAEPAEVVGAIFLDAPHNAIGRCIAYRGTLARCTVEPRGVLVPALLANAAGLLLFQYVARHILEQARGRGDARGLPIPGAVKRRPGK